MKHIVIVSVPPGQAPLWVREKWVGLSIPICHKPSQGQTQRGVLGGTPTNGNGYSVSAAEAIERLYHVAPDAADWWKSHLPAIPDCELVFSKDICQIAEIRSRPKR